MNARCHAQWLISIVLMGVVALCTATNLAMAKGPRDDDEDARTGRAPKTSRPANTPQPRATQPSNPAPRKTNPSPPVNTAPRKIDTPQPSFRRPSTPASSAPISSAPRYKAPAGSSTANRAITPSRNPTPATGSTPNRTVQPVFADTGSGGRKDKDKEPEPPKSDLRPPRINQPAGRNPGSQPWQAGTTKPGTSKPSTPSVTLPGTTPKLDGVPSYSGRGPTGSGVKTPSDLPRTGIVVPGGVGHTGGPTTPKLDFPGRTTGPTTPNRDLPGRTVGPTTPKLDFPSRTTGPTTPNRDLPGRTVGPTTPKLDFPARTTGPTTLNRSFPSRPGGTGPAMIDGRHGPGPNAPNLAPHQISQVNFHDRYQRGDYGTLAKGSVGRQVNLNEQYKLLSQKGDVARQLHLQNNVPRVVNVTNVTNVNVTKIYDPHRPYYHGWVSPHYVSSCFELSYCGPSFFAGACYYPRWNPWLDWSWHVRCHPIYDPRPVWCRPVIYDPCPLWVYYPVPVWTPLPEVACGTWVDVRPIVVQRQYDLQLLAVRFVDPGHPEEKLGPRYRVWYRNNGDQPLLTPFNVVALASNDDRLAADLPQAGVRVTSIDPGDTQSVDIRLPVDVYNMGRDARGLPTPFRYVSFIVDANREVNDVALNNNGVRLAPGDVLPVDPAAFAVQPAEVPAGGEVVIAGEGLGPKPGRVLVHLAGLEMDAEIEGWYDLGVRVALPKVPLAAEQEAELVVIRGDSAAANPIKVMVGPPQAQPAAFPAGPVLP